MTKMTIEDEIPLIKYIFLLSLLMWIILVSLFLFYLVQPFRVEFKIAIFDILGLK